jgi:hypothetical protein
MQSKCFLLLPCRNLPKCGNWNQDETLDRRRTCKRIIKGMKKWENACMLRPAPCFEERARATPIPSMNPN